LSEICHGEVDFKEELSLSRKKVVEGENNFGSDFGKSGR
jgi:hypothetical protein